MIDDTALGTPLLKFPFISERPFVNWYQMTKLLWQNKLISGPQTESLLVKLQEFFHKRYQIDISTY